MATLEKKAMMGRDMFFSKIRAFPENAWDRTECFDSELYIPPYGDESWKLTINLRIFYERVDPDKMLGPTLAAIARSKGWVVPAGNVGFYPDADDDAKWIRDWTQAEWDSFLRNVKNQAALWNHKFWLVPTNNYDTFDKAIADPKVFGKGAVYRPTVECLFNFEIALHYGYAHTTVKVVNVYGPNFFRSHNRLYSSGDAVIGPNESQDWRGNVVKTKYPVIAHEIGHSLGQPHIGKLRSLVLCGLAIDWERFPYQDALPWMFKGGSNADVCYGPHSAAGDIDNIMGAGDKFSKENGKPWLDRFFRHLNLSNTELFRAGGSWQVATTKTPPMRLA